MSDSADRLHVLISKIVSAANEATLRVGNGNHAVIDLPLWQAFGLVSAHLNFTNYATLREMFLGLCDSVLTDVRTMPFQKETVRNNWLGSVTAISEVFEAQNFGEGTGHVFQRHFSTRNLENLDAISERFQSVGLRESTEAELSEALAAVRDVIAELRKNEQLDGRILAVLSHYLQQMETVYSQAIDFGDEVFWKTYKETFATFVQLHPAIAELPNAEDIKGKIRTAAEKLASKSIAGVSIAANVATIAATGWSMLA